MKIFTVYFETLSSIHSTYGATALSGPPCLPQKTSQFFSLLLALLHPRIPTTCDVYFRTTSSNLVLGFQNPLRLTQNTLLMLCVQDAEFVSVKAFGTSIN